MMQSKLWEELLNPTSADLFKMAVGALVTWAVVELRYLQKRRHYRKTGKSTRREDRQKHLAARAVDQEENDSRPGESKKLQKR